MVEQFYLNYRSDPIRYYHSRSEWIMEIKEYSIFTKAPRLDLQYQMQFTILSGLSLLVVKVIILQTQPKKVDVSQAYLMTEITSVHKNLIIDIREMFALFFFFFLYFFHFRFFFVLPGVIYHIKMI